MTSPSPSPTPTAEIAAKMGLVSKRDGIYFVQSPRFAGGQFCVKDGVCSCGDEGCWHVESTSIAESLNLATDAVSPPEPAQQKGNGKVITPKQKTMVQVICNSRGLDAEELCQEWFGCSVAALQGHSINAYIDRLKNYKET